MAKLVGNEVRLSLIEIFAVFLRDKFFEGSWDNQLEWISKYGTEQQRSEDIPLILGLRDFEKMHNLNLRNFMPLEWLSFEPSIARKVQS
ncbi:MAG: hypothetical protein QMD21_07750 [Candidatus Thermoplasmatota archaeon]|nr:hypothetical protein [Candidatus Thermoplasmatota archaeon]